MTWMVLLAVLAGGLVAIQAPVNARLADSVGTFSAAAVSFAVGLAVLLMVASAAGQIGGLRATADVPIGYFVGGLFGAVFVVVALVAVPKIGAGSLTAGVVAGQLTMSMVIDRMGWFGLTPQLLTPSRVLGACLLIAGVALMMRRAPGL